MPTQETTFYQLSGWSTQDIYSETEMAEALEMTVDELRAALDSESYGPCPFPEKHIYSYHLHPLATGGVFKFNRSAYQVNLQRYNLLRWMQAKGLWTNPEACRAFLLSVFDQYKDGGDPEKFTLDLRSFVDAWEKGDLTYHPSIESHYKAIQVRRLIWIQSGYLKGLNLKITPHSCIFNSPDESNHDITIPWQWLAFNRQHGFYDQRHLPMVKPEFIPQTRPDQWEIFTPDVVLAPGDLIVLEKFVFDDYREFMGMVIRIRGDEIDITSNGLYLMDFDKAEIRSYIKRQNL